jgi:hypothetical protein
VLRCGTLYGIFRSSPKPSDFSFYVVRLRSLRRLYVYTRSSDRRQDLDGGEHESGEEADVYRRRSSLTDTFPVAPRGSPPKDLQEVGRMCWGTHSPHQFITFFSCLSKRMRHLGPLSMSANVSSGPARLPMRGKTVLESSGVCRCRIRWISGSLPK